MALRLSLFRRFLFSFCARSRVYTSTRGGTGTAIQLSRGRSNVILSQRASFGPGHSDSHPLQLSGVQHLEAVTVYFPHLRPVRCPPHIAYLEKEFFVFQSTQKSALLMGRRFGCN